MLDREVYNKRIDWYKKARFGMFIHWGLYAIPARGEWVRSVEQMGEEEYLAFFDEFNPVDYNPQEWAKAAKEAGMKYAVLTAKHHDGFCLVDSELTDFDRRLYYHIMESAVGSIPLYGIRREQVERIRLLQDGSELKPVNNFATKNYPEVVFVNVADAPQLPDPTDTVAEITMKEEAGWLEERKG